MQIDWGDLRRVEPISRHFGYDRGSPIDRYYIERFLARHAGDIRGRVIEIGDDSYTQQFGAGRVTQCDILHVSDQNPKATIVADLASGTSIPSDAFDCAIITQTLHLIYDIRAALYTLHRILRPGGVLLATVPGISPISIDEWSQTWYWSLTHACAKVLFDEVFGAEATRIDVYGNAFAAMCFLEGVAVEEVPASELDHLDPNYVVSITIRAEKAGAD